MAWREREVWLNFVFLGDGRGEDKKERDEKRWGKSSWKTGTYKILCASQFTIPDTAGTSPYPVCNYTDMRSSQPNQATRNPDFSYSLVSSTSFSSSSPHLSLSRPLQSLQNTKLSHPSLSLRAMIMSWHWVQHTPSTAYTEYSIHRVQHTPSTAYTKYCIPWVQHTPSTAYTEYSIPKIVCLPFILMIPSQPLNVASGSGVPP